MLQILFWHHLKACLVYNNNLILQLQQNKHTQKNPSVQFLQVIFSYLALVALKNPK